MQEVANMAMQTFRGAGGLGVYVAPHPENDADSLGEYEHTPLAQDTLTASEQRLERVLVGVAAVLWIGIGTLVAVWLV
jgi:hypothetical protein